MGERELMTSKDPWEGVRRPSTWLIGRQVLDKVTHCSRRPRHSDPEAANFQGDLKVGAVVAHASGSTRVDHGRHRWG